MSYTEREIINLVNPEKHPRYVYFENSGEEKFKSFLAVPLNVGGRCLGVLNLQRTVERRFPPSVVDVVKSVCTQVANLLLTSKMLKVLSGDKKTSFQQIDEKLDSEKNRIIRGASASGGIAVGKAFIFQRDDLISDIKPVETANPSKELLLLEFAVRDSKKETVELENKALSLISEADASIFNVHLLFLEDKALLDTIRTLISEKRYSAEYAIKTVHDDYQNRFSKLQDPIFREKASDLKDVIFRLIKNLGTQRGAESGKASSELESNRIIICSELLPSDLIRLPIDKISGIVCEKGGVTAHVAILAKALNIPFLMGVSNILELVEENDVLIIDCHAEILYVKPSGQLIDQFTETLRAASKLNTGHDTEPALTPDGKKITVRANISLVSEAAMLSNYGAEGIGLYRTEFLFMIRDHMPSEDVQSAVYSKVLKCAKNETVVFRFLDIGADKPLPYIPLPMENNPALGWRGIRILLAKRELFKSQLNAVLTVSHNANLCLLFPMISVTSEIIQIKQILSEVESELHSKKIPHNSNYKLGIMLEVPSAMLLMDELIKYVDFMSIGSNDLLQYTFAADRTNEYVATFIRSLHPGFLKVLKQIGDFFAAHPEKTLSICGEMAANPMAIPFLIGAGIHELSMSLNQIAQVKKMIRIFTLKECREMLDEAMGFDNPESVLCLVKQMLADKEL